MSDNYNLKTDVQATNGLVRLSGSITCESMKAFRYACCETISWLNEVRTKAPDSREPEDWALVLVIDTCGGCADSTAEIVSFMEYVRTTIFPWLFIRVFISDNALSGGMLLLQMATPGNRYMFKKGLGLIHHGQVTANYEGISVHDYQVRMAENTWSHLVYGEFLLRSSEYFAKNTDVFYEEMLTESTQTPEYWLKMGLVDHIVDKWPQWAITAPGGDDSNAPFMRSINMEDSTLMRMFGSHLYVGEVCTVTAVQTLIRVLETEMREKENELVTIWFSWGAFEGDVRDELVRARDRLDALAESGLHPSFKLRAIFNSPVQLFTCILTSSKLFKEVKITDSSTVMVRGQQYTVEGRKAEIMSFMRDTDRDHEKVYDYMLRDYVKVYDFKKLWDRVRKRDHVLSAREFVGIGLADEVIEWRIPVSGNPIFMPYRVIDGPLKMQSVLFADL